jgi:hypothetical protein
MGSREDECQIDTTQTQIDISPQAGLHRCGIRGWLRLY